MRKPNFKIFFILLILILFVLSTIIYFIFVEQRYGGYKHPDFKTIYTKEEHIEKISAQTQELFAKELASGEIKNFFVDILYAFGDNDPEYFLIELELGVEVQTVSTNFPQTYTTSFAHVIGFIENDEYFIGLKYYQTFRAGKSAYTYFNFGSSLKYYGGGVQAVEQNGQIITLVTYNCLDYSFTDSHSHTNSEECGYGKIIAPSDFDFLMKNNKKFSTRKLLDSYIHPEFKTNISHQKHISNLKERTERIFSQEFNSCAIIGYKVELINSFINDSPEYFLIELELTVSANEIFPYYSNCFSSPDINYAHIIGYIYNDEYYTGLSQYASFRIGKSAYSYFENPKGSKYYGNGVFAIQQEDDIICVSDFNCLGFHANHTHYNNQSCKQGNIIQPEDFQSLAHNNRKHYEKKYDDFWR